MMVFPVQAESTASSQQNVSIGKSNQTGKKDDRPRAPSMQNIDCFFDGATLFIEFSVPEGDCTLWVNAGGAVQCHTFSTEAPAEIYIGRVCGATLTLTTESHTYTGVIESQ